MTVIATMIGRSGTAHATDSLLTVRGKTGERVVVELTRFRGHLTIWVGGLHDAEEACTTSTVSG